ncbi:hypothetical protein AMS68_001317 [Peltaster fructicola]|uniref:Uncharacterized protein n=1 Tax=Peltaster fructicola TaxID=286661 RepID=A0A6H0XMS8_9PEZI|nr:hypothetical protein AMS68_001317 [Peltaster fructicola]
MERSLDQLKQLDKLPLDEQLAVASDLCNHAHRADMIIRWLLAKLSQYHTQQAWQLLTKCIRLVQPALLPSRLKGSTLLELIIKRPVPAMDDTLRTILSVQPQILAVESLLAARFFAVWAPENIDTALQVWELRRSTNDQDFSEHCLLPAARLYTQASRKRRHEHGSHAVQLERLIAKHVFLKSRAAFLKHSDTSITLQLRNLDQSVFPNLLNIAIRCGSINTQRQMLQEIAWNDVVFNTLAEQADLDTILKMLDVVKERSTLSIGTFQRLLSTHFDWSLIIKVIAMNPRVFTELGRLFDAIAEDPRPEIKDLVILPIMRAFAEDRRLPEFLDLWQGQVGRSPVWFELDDALRSLLEEHLTSQQIFELVKARLESTENSSALYIVTSAILRGITNTETLDLLVPIAKTVYDQSQDYETVGFWTLALRLHEICTPKDVRTKLLTAGSRCACKSGTVALEAALFTARLCQIHGEGQAFLRKLSKASYKNAAAVLIRYPSLIIYLEEDDRKRLITSLMNEEQISTIAALQEAAMCSPDVGRLIAQLSIDTGAITLLTKQSNHQIGKEQKERFLQLAKTSEHITDEQLVLTGRLLSNTTQLGIEDVWQICAKLDPQSSLSHHLAIIAGITRLAIRQHTAAEAVDLINMTCSKIASQAQKSSIRTHASMLGFARVLSTATEHLPDLDQKQQGVLHLACDNACKTVLPLLDRLQQQTSEAMAIAGLLEICLALTRFGTQRTQEIQRLAALVLTKYTVAMSLPIQHPAVCAYRVMCIGDSDITLLAHAASRSLNMLNSMDRAAIIEAYSQALQDPQATIIQSLLSEEFSSSTLVIARVTLHSLPKDTELVSMLLHVIKSLRSMDANTTGAALEFLDASFREIHINQHLIEEMLAALHQLAAPKDA